jgi:hypothetical protein
MGLFWKLGKPGANHSVRVCDTVSVFIRILSGVVRVRCVPLLEEPEYVVNQVAAI